MKARSGIPGVIAALVAAFLPAATARAAGPDLVVTTLTLNPTSPKVGSPVSILATVKNTGTDDATSTFYVGYFLDGTLCAVGSVSGGLDAGDSTVESTNDPECQPDEPGTHTIEVIADEGKDIAEASESNNTLKKTFTWQPKPLPDLVVDAISLDPDDPIAGEPLEILSRIRNQGNADAAKAFYIHWYLDGDKCFEGKMSFGLDAGESSDEAPGTDPATCRPTDGGPHELRVVVDPGKSVEESDETNNEREIEETWAASLLPNLAVSIVKAWPASPAVGSTALFTATVANEGDVAVEGVEVEFLLDGKACDVQTVASSLEPGASTDVSTKAAACQPDVAGEHEVRAVADPDGVVAESDETDNEAAVVLAWGTGSTGADAAAGADTAGGEDAGGGDAAGADDAATGGDGESPVDGAVAGDDAVVYNEAGVPIHINVDSGSGSVRPPVRSGGGCSAAPVGLPVGLLGCLLPFVLLCRRIGVRRTP